MHFGEKCEKDCIYKDGFGICFFTKECKKKNNRLKPPKSKIKPKE